MYRRDFLKAGSVLAGCLGLHPLAFSQPATKATGRLKQSVARWCFADMPIELLCENLQDMGITGMDLVAPEDWDTCRRYGITPCMVAGAGSFLEPEAGSQRRFGPAFGWNRQENHVFLIKTIKEKIDMVAAAGLPAIIDLIGDRQGMSDEAGIANCVIGLREVIPLLESRNVTLALELLNSKIDHPDYQGDHTAFGVEVCKRLGSDRIKLVYDAYHMQIMEGNLINTIRENIGFIAHFHVAGVPGRNEINDSQEVNWRAVATVIAGLHFDGYVTHEWLPSTSDPMGELRRAVELLAV